MLLLVIVCDVLIVAYVAAITEYVALPIVLVECVGYFGRKVTSS